MRNGLESYNLLNTCSGIFYETEHTSIRLKEYFEKVIKPKGKYLNNAKIMLEFTINTINKY